MKVIPKHIHKKLWSIYNHQYAVKKLVGEIEEWADILNITDEDGWSWGMNIDMQGNIDSPESSANLLQEFIDLKT